MCPQDRASLLRIPMFLWSFFRDEYVRRVRLQTNGTDEAIIEWRVLLIIFILRGVSLIVQTTFRDRPFLDPCSFR